MNDSFLLHCLCNHTLKHTERNLWSENKKFFFNYVISIARNKFIFLINENCNSSKNLIKWLEPFGASVVYFDQHLGAAHPNADQNMLFWHFLSKKAEKGRKGKKKHENWCKIQHYIFLIAPERWSRVLFQEKIFFSFFAQKTLKKFN